MIAPPPPTQTTNSNGDSDSDWDDDDDFSSRKINIKIKPIAQVTPSKISTSVDELRATVGTWKSLANINLVKPNSRRHHQSTLQINNIDEQERPISMLVPTTLPPVDLLSDGRCLEPASSDILNAGIQSPFSVAGSIQVLDNVSAIKIPIAIAIQEALHAKFLKKGANGTNVSQLVGQVKLAVPPRILDMKLSELDHKLQVTLVSSMPFDKIDLNKEFVNDTDNNINSSKPFLPSSNTRRLSIDMKAVQGYVQKQSSAHPNANYYMVPEFLKYSIRSQDNKPPVCIIPLVAVSHWLCDLNITKVRIDIQSVEQILKDSEITSDDIRNIRINMQVNGGVIAHKTKPEANWNPLESRLTWSFTNLTELIEKSTLNNVTSCLARFDLDDGPSAPSNVSIQFSITGKTITGTHIILNSINNYEITKQKQEVRTGIFTCQA